MSTATEAPLLSNVEAGVLTLTLNRPKTLNSLSPDLLDALAQALGKAADDDDVRCVVLTGAGRAFSSGAALAGDPREFDVRAALRDHYNPAVRALHELEKPVVASIRGMAAGAGAALAFGADFRVLADDASFSVLFVRIGLAPDAGASYHLPRLVGGARAAELALLGDDVDAERALAIGLATSVVAGERLEEETAELAGRLARGPRALGLIKRQLRASSENTLEAQLEVEVDTQGRASESEDFIEGVSAFLDKREAHFSGR